MGLEQILQTCYGRLVVCLCTLLVPLQIANFYYMTSVTPALQGAHRPGALNNNRLTMKIGSLNSLDLSEIVDAVDKAYIMDSSGMYMIVPNVISSVPSSLSMSGNHSGNMLTICTQTSPDHLHHLINMVEVWTGPISVSVFVVGENAADALKNIVSYHECLHKVREQVNFHIVYPISHKPIDLWRVLEVDINCDIYINSYFKNSANFKTNYDLKNVPYPNNMLRNVAINNAFSLYIQVIDIDFIPSMHLSEQFGSFIKRKMRTKTDKVVYVTPAFETNATDRLTKEIIAEQWDSGNFRQFYKNLCAKCHDPTDYDRWFKLPKIPFLDVGYMADWKPVWEPFYIVRKEDVPMYDERFKQYGFNRISQVCEVNMAGFQFAVLNNAFIAHQGFKEPGQFHETKTQENNDNRALYRTLKQELKQRYPNSTRTCD